MTEQVEHRYLGAIRFLDRVTGGIITHRMQLAAPGVTLFRNRSMLYVISAAPGFHDYVTAFSSPSPPGGGNFTVTLSCTDPSGEYLPRVFTVQMPRDPESAHSSAAASLFRPIDIPLYPTPRAVLGVNWSAIRASVTIDGSGGSIVGALLRVVRTIDSKILGSGFSDERGEALVAVAGIPITDFAAGDPEGPATGPVVVCEVAANLEISFNPAAAWPFDSEVAEDQHPGFVRKTLPLTLKTGRTETIPVSITI